MPKKKQNKKNLQLEDQNDSEISFGNDEENKNIQLFDNTYLQ